jgi:hypothetical protein
VERDGPAIERWKQKDWPRVELLKEIFKRQS